MAIAGSDDILRKISSQIDFQFPGFIREEGPQFVAFMKAYFEFMEQSNNPVETARAIRDNVDIDRTVDSFIEYFRREFMVNIPKTTLADKRLLTKHIREFYRSRGSQESYRFLFRALYNQEVEFYYPGDDILRASDGRWVRETLLRVAAPLTIDPSEFENKSVKGAVSGAIAFVQRVIPTESSGIAVYDLYIDNVVGTFVNDEHVFEIGNESNYATVNSNTGSIVDLSVVDGGAYHHLNDRIVISGAGSTETAIGLVTEVNNRNAVMVKTVKGGAGYTKENTRLIVNGGNGKNFAAKIASWSKEAISGGKSINTDLIGPMKNIPINTGRYFIAKGQNTSPVGTKLTGTVKITSGSTTVYGQSTNFISELTVGDLVRVKGCANTLRVQSISTAQTFTSVYISPVTISTGANAYIGMAAANAYTVLSKALKFSTNEFYSINSIAILNPGYSYTSMPTITAIDDFMNPLNISDGYGGYYGKNAVLIANNAPGSISKMRIINKGANFNRYELASLYNETQSNAVYAESQTGAKISGVANTKYLVRKTTFNGTGLAKPSGFIQLNGRYIDTKGFLSWNNKLQDNFYYQEFSYVLRIGQVLEKYRNIIKKLVHPAGTKMFGEYTVTSEINVLETIADSSPVTIRRNIVERIRATDIIVGNATFNTSRLENIISANNTASATYIANTFISSSVVAANSTQRSEKFILQNDVYATVEYANNIINQYNSFIISPYSTITVGSFDGKPRLVVSGSIGALFANGALRANTGSVQVGGIGTNVYIVTNPGEPSTGVQVYQVNSIFSNTAFTLRTNYSPSTSANVRIWYSTSV
jgi:hypothetical protein